MFDELNNGVETQQEQVVEASQQNTANEISKAESMRALREQRDAAERKAAEYERYIQQNMSQQQTTKMQLHEEDDMDISDDNYVEGKHLKKYIKKLEKKIESNYRTILANPDLYDKGYTAYELIKNSGIASNNNNDYEDVDRRVAQNQSKPRSASNVAPQVSESPLGEVTNIGRRIISEKQAAEIIRQSSQYADQFQQ